MKTFYANLIIILLFISCKKEESDQTVKDPVPFAQLLPETTFDGSNGKVIDLGSFDFPVNTDFTFIGKIYPTDLKDYGRVWDIAHKKGNFRFHHNLNNQGRVAVGQFTYVLDALDYWEVNTWINAAIQYSYSTKELKLFKNGILVKILTDVRLPEGKSDNLIIGASNWGGNFPNSTEPNSIMKTKNLRFYFGLLSEKRMEELLNE